MKKINLDKHVWEGWTVQCFINELEPSFNQIMRGDSWSSPFKSKVEIKKWCMDNQPYYKKHIPDVVNYFEARLYSNSL
jgi:hypothetical protein